MAFTRQACPIWLMVDLVGNILDDTYYAHFLTNTLPYIPQLVYRDPNGNTVWTGGVVQFQPSGTLPNNLYFNDELVYRIEIRQGPTQSDPLIWEIDDFVPVAGGVDPVDSINISTDNQITNPQFVLVDFQSPVTVTNTQDVKIAPGWVLSVVGTGTVTLRQLVFTGSENLPTNASYGLEIAASGTLSAVNLIQTFDNTGGLWSNTAVSAGITGRSDDGAPHAFTVKLIDSNGNPTTIISDNFAISDTFTEYSEAVGVSASTNPDVPPDASIDFVIELPVSGTVQITSLQIVGQSLSGETPVAVPYEQDTIERQLDHTYNVDRTGLLEKAIPSILVGWDFPVNPAQGTNAGAFTMTTNPAYSWDQTIVKSTVGNCTVARSTDTGGFEVTTANPDEAFFTMQYLDGLVVKKILGGELSVNVSAYHDGTSLNVGCRVYLYRTGSTGVFPDLNTNLLIGALTYSSGFGIFTKNNTVNQGLNWTEIERPGKLEAVGTLSTVTSADEINAIQDLKFEGYEVTDAAEIADTDKFCMVVTFGVPTTGSIVTINSVSLVPGSIATRPAPLSWNQTALQCQAYYAMSFRLGVLPAQAVGNNTGESYNIQVSGAASAGAFGPIIRFRTEMRATPTVTLFNPAAANAQIRDIATATDWTTSAVTDVSSQGFPTTGSTPVGSTAGNACSVHWTANARIGIV